MVPSGPQFLWPLKGMCRLFIPDTGSGPSLASSTLSLFSSLPSSGIFLALWNSRLATSSEMLPTVSYFLRSVQQCSERSSPTQETTYWLPTFWWWLSSPSSSWRSWTTCSSEPFRTLGRRTGRQLPDRSGIRRLPQFSFLLFLFLDAATLSGSLQTCMRWEQIPLLYK